MPLVKPEIQKAVRAVVQEAFPETAKSQAAENTITEALDASGLSTERIAEELTTIATSSGNDSLRLRALETALKARGALKDSPPVIPSFTINIQPFAPEAVKPETTILFPRKIAYGLKEIPVEPSKDLVS